MRGCRDEVVSKNEAKDNIKESRVKLHARKPKCRFWRHQKSQNDEIGDDISLKADKNDACIVKKQKGVSLDDPAFKRNENLVTHDDSTAYETKFGNGKVFGNEKLEADGPEAEIKDNHNNKAPEDIKTQASDSNLENTVAET